MADSITPGSNHLARVRHHRERVHRAHADLHGAALESARKHYAETATAGAHMPPASAMPTMAGETPAVVR